MERQFVNLLEDGTKVDEVYIASEKQLRTNRNGNLYLQVRVSDKTGSMTTMLWNAHQSHFDEFENGDYVKIQGTAQLYNGEMQILARNVNKHHADVDEADFVTLSDVKVTEMIQRISALLRGMQNPELRNLADCFLVDEAFLKKFRSAPAGIKNHHAYRGGLLEHVLSLMEVANVVAPRYPQIDADILLMGAFLHDVGKTEELTYDPDLGYSDAGQLIGHLVQGVSILEAKIRETEKLSGESFSNDTANRLKHMIISHHGRYEFGSPKLPMTLEAELLHHLDTLDARIHTMTQLIEDDVNKQSAWTVYNPPLQRKILKPANPTSS